MSRTSLYFTGLLAAVLLTPFAARVALAVFGTGNPLALIVTTFLLSVGGAAVVLWLANWSTR